MEARKIIKEMSKYKSLFGQIALRYLDDEVLATQYIHEIYEQIVANPGTMDAYFEEGLINEITKFCTKSKSIK